MIANEKIGNGCTKIQLRNADWKERIQRVIDDCRKDLSSEFRNGNSDRKVEARMKVLLDKALSINQIDEIEQSITMQPQVKAQRLKRTAKEMINSTKIEHSKMMLTNFTDK